VTDTDIFMYLVCRIKAELRIHYGDFSVFKLAMNQRVKIICIVYR
jgi:hypothetical protein